MDNLEAGVNTGIGAPRTHQVHRVIGHFADCLRELPSTDRTPDFWICQP